MSAIEQKSICIPYGCDDLGRLKSVLVHTPDKSLKHINESNKDYWLFDRVPDIEKYIKEHKKYCNLLKSHGVEVYQLKDYVVKNKDKINKLPNLTFLHDIAVVSKKGAILSSMAWDGRRKEQNIVKEALKNLGIPILFEFDSEMDSFEGFLLLSEKTILVTDTERHKKSSIQKFINYAQKYFDEIIYAEIPKARRFMHPDTVYNRVKENLALCFLPAFKDTYLFRDGKSEKIDFEKHINIRGIEIINVSDSEQKKLACSFVPLKSGVIFHYDIALNRETKKKLLTRGIEIIPFHPDAILAGGGSLRCHTLRLHRTNC